MRHHTTSMPLFDRPGSEAGARRVPLNSSVEPDDAARLGRQVLAVVARLRAGPARNTELHQIATRFSARLGEAKAAGLIRGWLKSKVPGMPGVIEYRLIGDDAAE